MINPTKYTSHQPVQTKAEESFFLNVIQAIKDNRWYAADHESMRGGIALIRAVKILSESTPPQPTTAQITELFRRVALIEKSLVQSWRFPPPPPPPEPWRDPITDEILANPWAAPTSDTDSNRARDIVMKADPNLGLWLKKIASVGDTYSTVAEMKAAEARRVALNGISYGEKEHRASNPYLDNSVSASEEQGRFRAQHGDLVSFVYKQESVPMRFPWDGESTHRDTWGRCIQSLNDEPVLGVGGGDCVLLAETISRQMVAAERAAAEEALKQAETRAAALRLRAA